MRQAAVYRGTYEEVRLPLKTAAKKGPGEKLAVFSPLRRRVERVPVPCPLEDDLASRLRHAPEVPVGVHDAQAIVGRRDTERSEGGEGGRWRGVAIWGRLVCEFSMYEERERE